MVTGNFVDADSVGRWRGQCEILRQTRVAQILGLVIRSRSSRGGREREGKKKRNPVGMEDSKVEYGIEKEMRIRITMNETAYRKQQRMEWND